VRGVHNEAKADCDGIVRNVRSRVVRARLRRWFDDGIGRRHEEGGALASGGKLDALFRAIGDAVSSMLADPTFGLVVRVAAAYWIVVWLATSLWAFVDIRRRTGNPLLPYASAAAVVMASPLLFPFAVLVHRVVRPSATVAERRLSELRDASLIGELDETRCPGCGTATDEDWLICPSCRRPLGHRCEHCERTVRTEWDVCAWCGSALAAEVRQDIARR
jgi:RNA polymerase subunit RPABC4/transcription elongation factor Spt4